MATTGTRAALDLQHRPRHTPTLPTARPRRRSSSSAAPSAVATVHPPVTDEIVLTGGDRAASPPLRRLLAMTDAAALAVGWGVTALVLLVREVEVSAVELVLKGIVVVILGALLLAASGLYRRQLCAVRAEEITRIVRSCIALNLVVLALLGGHGLSVAAVGALAGAVTWAALLAFERGLFREWIQLRRAAGDFIAPVLVMGGNEDAASRTAAFLDENTYLGFDVRGTVRPTGKVGSSTMVEELVSQARETGSTGVILDAGSLTGDQLNDAVRHLSEVGLHVHVHSGLRGVDRRRITVSPLADETFLHVAPLSLSRRQLVVKRAMDVLLAGTMLVLASPILLLVAIAVWLEDRGPILFRQERIGHGGEPFVLYKVRTMVVDADQRLAELRDDNDRDGPLFKLAHDPRITRVGRFLRATSIDELPQLLNVLEGTMSLVGPRPALPAEVSQFDRRLRARLGVKPGVTGLWQVEARDLPNFDLYRRYDLLYVQNWSILSDLSLIARTAYVVGLRGLRALVPARARGTGLLE